MSLYSLHRLPGEDRPDAALVVCGIGSRGAPVPMLATRIAAQGMQVCYMERHGDERLAGGPGAVAEYIRAMSAHVATIAESGRRVHVVATSFGAWLMLLAMKEGIKLDSLALIAPLIDPHAALDRAFKKEDGFYEMPVPMSRNSEAEDEKDKKRVLRIRETNIDEAPAIARGHHINVPTIAIIGTGDEVELPENIERLTGPNVALHQIAEADHRGVLTNRATRDLLAGFYGRVIPEAAA